MNRKGEEGTAVSVTSVIDDETANSDVQHVLIDVPAVGLGFTNPFETKKVATTKPKIRVIANDGEENSKLSTDEGSVDGSLPQATWVMHDDISDEFSNAVAKFDRFFEMLELLCDKHPVKQISKSLQKLPKLPKCKKHLIPSTGDPRMWALIELNLNGMTFILMEVDTSDQAKALSSYLIQLKIPSDWCNQQNEIAKRLVQKSLTWPKGYITKISVPEAALIVKHPSSKTAAKGVILEEALEPWADRIFSKLQALSNRSE